jgi:hypothetical protein
MTDIGKAQSRDDLKLTIQKPTDGLSGIPKLVSLRIRRQTMTLLKGYAKKKEVDNYGSN